MTNNEAVVKVFIIIFFISISLAVVNCVNNGLESDAKVKIERAKAGCK